MNKVNPNDLVQESAMQDSTCPKCGALMINDDCSCGMKAEDIAKMAAMRKQENQLPVQAETEQEPQKAPEQVQQPEMPSLPSAKEILRNLPGAPSQEQIDVWKQEFGSVYTFALSAKELYVWRPLKRIEWQQLQSQEALMKDESKFQEHIVLRATLWPKFEPITLSGSRAGLIPTLFGVVMQGSYFIPAEVAINLVEEL